MTDVIEALAVKHLQVGVFTNASLPANAPDGSIYYDSTNNKLVIMANGSYETITSA